MWTSVQNSQSPSFFFRKHDLTALSDLVDARLVAEKEQYDANLKKRRKRVSINTTKARSEVKLLKHFTKLYGWREVFTDGDVLWSGLSLPAEDLSVCLQVPTNRMPGMSELAHKKTSGYYLNKFREYFPEEFDFFPRTFLIPEDYEDFVAFFNKQNSSKATAKNASQNGAQSAMFIAKPSAGAQGDGIRLVQHLRDLNLSAYSQRANELVVQQYIANPLLLDAKKFDLRLYVLISSDEPYLCYLNDEGMARFCAENYERPNDKNLRNAYMHLTNYSLNKDHPAFRTPDATTDIFGVNQASKRLFSSVLQQIQQEQSLDVAAIKASIESVIVKFLTAMRPFILFNNRCAFGGAPTTTTAGEHKCFHVLGFDILLDSTGRPWILEVNANPSFNIEHEVYHSDGRTECEISPVDKYIKAKVVGDAIQLVLKSKEKQMQIGAGGQYRSWKCIVAGDENAQGSAEMDVFKKILDIYSKLSGVKFRAALTATRFVKLAGYANMTNERVTKMDYDLIFKRILRGQYSQQHMDIYDFVRAIEEIASRLDATYDPNNKCESVTRLVDNLIAQMDK